MEWRKGAKERRGGDFDKRREKKKEEEKYNEEMEKVWKRLTLFCSP